MHCVNELKTTKQKVTELCYDNFMTILGQRPGIGHVHCILGVTDGGVIGNFLPESCFVGAAQNSFLYQL